MHASERVRTPPRWSRPTHPRQDVAHQVKYVHFTSPIRRYPDLLVHRCLRALWRGQSSPAGLGSHADRASVAERRAMEAERAVMQLYACQVAAIHVGKVFSCTVVGVHRAGAFVRVQDPFLEGLARSETLPDDYDVLEEEMSLVGRRSGQRISVGDTLELVLSNVNLSRRLIDFSPPRAKPAPSQRPDRRGPREKARQMRQTRPRKPRRTK